MDKITNGNLPTTTTVKKDEEMPFEGQVNKGPTTPGTDKNGMKIQGEDTSSK